MNKPPLLHLCQFAKRIAQLLQTPKVQASTEAQAILDDFLGSVYALAFATDLGFEDRPDRPIEISTVRMRAAQLSEGHVRKDGKWMAGFYFNSALYRLSAVYPRVMRMATGGGGDAKELRPLAEKLYRDAGGTEWEYGNLRTIHSQGNQLMHDTNGIYGARRRDAGLRNATSAASELLAFIEAWAAKS